MISEYYLLLSKLLVKLHLAKIAYILIYPFAKTSKAQKLPIDRAEKILNDISKDKGESCIKNHTRPLSLCYDLQIIIPVYNVQKYIEECIDSVTRQQTKYKIKTVIINDGSKDYSREILKKYEHHQDIEIIDQENRGLSGARNRGLEKIDAHYVMFVDSDDRLLEGAIDKLLNKAYQTNADIVAGGYRTFHSSKILSSKTYKEEDYATHSGGGYVWGKIYKSDIFKNIGFPERYWFEDTLNSLVIADLSKHNCIIDSIVYDYRQNPKGITQSSKGSYKNIDSYWVTKRLLQDRLELGIQDNQRLYEQMLKQVCWNCIRVASIGNKDVDFALFSCCVDLWNRRFSNFKTEQDKYKDLENALRTNNYNLYKLNCFLIR